VRTIALRTRSLEVSDGSLDGVDADGAKYGVEARGVLGVPVSDEEPEAPPGFLEVGCEVAADLRDPRAVGAGGHAE